MSPQSIPSEPAPSPRFLGYASEFEVDDEHLFPRWLSALALIVLISAALFQTLGVGTLWNDRARIDDIHLRSTIGLAASWTHPFSTIDPPLAQTFYYFEYQMFGGERIGGYHAISIVLLAALVLVLWGFLGKLRAPRPWWICAAVAVSPVTVGTAALIGNQPLVLGLFIALLGGFFWLRGSNIDALDPEFEQPTRLRLPANLIVLRTIALMFFAMALLSDARLWPLPLVALVAEIWRLRHVSARRAIGLSIVALAGLVFFVGRSIGTSNASSPPNPAPLWRAILLVQIAALSVLRTFVPGRGIAEAVLFNRVPWAGIIFLLLAGAIVALALKITRRERARSLADGEDESTAEGPGDQSPFNWIRLSRGALTALAILLLLCLPIALSLDCADHEALFGDGGAWLASIAILAAGVAIVDRLRIHLEWRTERVRPEAVARLFAFAAVVLLLLLGTGAWFNAAALAHERDLWTRAAAANPSSVRLANTAAEALVRGEDVDGAVARYVDILAAHPDDPAALRGLADLRAQRKHYDQAIGLCRHLASLRPGDAQPIDREAELYAANGLVDQAIRLSRRALELNPRDAIAENDLALQLDAQEKFDEAADHYRAAIALDPLFCPPRINLATISFRKGQIQEAADSLVEVTRIDPKNFEAYANAGAMLAEMKQYPKAENMLRSALSIKSDSKEVWQNLSIVLEAEGRTNEARYVRDKANDAARKAGE